MYNKIKLYVKGLDEQMEGGVPVGSVVMIVGTSGSMKSSFAFNILYHSAKDEGIKGLYISLEQNRKSLTQHMKKLGMDLDIVKDSVTVMDLGKLRKELGEEVISLGFKSDAGKRTGWMHTLKEQIENYKKMLGFEIVVIDSLNALCVLSVMDNPRNEMYHFFEGLRDMKLSTFVISEMRGDMKTFGEYGVESFLADGIIYLTLERTGRSVGRYINIVKMRETKHPTDYFPLLVTHHGFEIIAK